jgi:hypothetical protein
MCQGSAVAVLGLTAWAASEVLVVLVAVALS